MKIAMVSTPFISVPPEKYGGTELVVYELVEGLAANGHDVTLFATGGASTAAELRFLYREPQWPPCPLTELNHVSWAVSEILADGTFDIVHVHSAFALTALRTFPGLPLVYTVHHAREEEFSDFYRYFPDAYFIAISANQKRLEVPFPRCDVIHHGLDPRRYEWSAEPGDHVCFLARFARIKGPHVAIDAAEKAGVPIQLAGETHPSEREFAEKEVVPRLEHPRVAHVGCLDHRGKVALLQSSRALLAPIDWEEPFGLFLIEAMLCGCPPVAFPRGSVPEIVEPGVTGFVVETADEMAEAIRPGGVVDSFDRERCRERAAERFSRSRFVSDHERTYAKVQANRAGKMVHPEIEGV
ncbi:MAG: glycosyltransferase family 4 protein [Verrucomicrobiales bacterium]